MKELDFRSNIKRRWKMSKKTRNYASRGPQPLVGRRTPSAAEKREPGPRLDFGQPLAEWRINHQGYWPSGHAP